MKNLFFSQNTLFLNLNFQNFGMNGIFNSVNSIILLILIQTNSLFAQDYEWAIQPQFAGAGVFSEGLVMVQQKVQQNWKTGFIDKHGNWVIKPQFEQTGTFSEGLVGVRQNGKWGFIDKQGNWAIRLQFEAAWDFSEGLAGVRQNGKWGCIDKQGNWIIKPQFESAPSFSEGLAQVQQNEQFGFIDKQGNWVIKPLFEDVDDFSEGLALVRQNGHWGFIDKQGNWIIKPRFGIGRYFSEDLAGFSQNGKWGFIDKQGNWAIKPQFEDVYGFHEGLATVKQNGKWGFINKQGNWVIEPQFKEISFFSEGLARVQQSEKYGYIDKQGNWVIQPQFESARDFIEGLALAMVEENGKCGYIKNPLIHKANQTITDSQKPQIYLSSVPQKVQTDKIRLTGKATDNTSISEIRLNNEELAFKPKTGEFTTEIALNIGKNTFTLIAKDEAGNTAEQKFEIEREFVDPEIEELRQAKYFALLMSVQNYQDNSITDLKYPHQHHEQLKQLLTEKYHFEPQNILSYKDLSRNDFYNAFDALREKIANEPNANILIFYAGHGSLDINNTAIGFWYPSDAQQSQKGTWLKNKDIIDELNSEGLKNAKHRLLLVDACFGGSLFDVMNVEPDWENADKNIVQKYRLGSYRGITSGNKETVLDSSPFFKAFLRTLQTNPKKHLSTSSLFYQVEQDTEVKKLSNSPQYKPFAGDTGGEFIFLKK